MTRSKYYDKKNILYLFYPITSDLSPDWQRCESMLKRINQIFLFSFIISALKLTLAMQENFVIGTILYW